MKHLEEYRGARAVRRLVEQLERTVTRPWTLMEVCGGQTHSILRHGLDELLPAGLELVHGPGCPVCVTPVEVLDRAHELAAQEGVVLCTYGDMLRVPGSRTDLYQVRARGGDVRVVHSPLAALEVAAANPSRQVVMLAVGFETTAPATALLARRARELGIANLSLLVSHVRVPPAMEAILASGECRVQGFLAAGHVCAVMGLEEYPAIAERHRVPVVVTGFEPVDLLQGVLACVRQLEQGRCEVENPYARAVRPEGNTAARELLREVFVVADREWRGLGVLPRGGLELAPAYREFDALERFGASERAPAPTGECQSHRVLQGLLRPFECPAFGTRCTPEHPLGATMVSSEGACAAYHLHRDLSP